MKKYQMKKYHVGDRTVVIIDGDLYERLLPLAEGQSEPAVEVPTKKLGRPRKERKIRPGRNAIMSAVVDHEERKRRVKVTPELEAAVADDIAAGMSLGDICRKHIISVSAYYRIKNESRSKPVVEENI